MVNSNIIVVVWVTVISTVMMYNTGNILIKNIDMFSTVLLDCLSTQRMLLTYSLKEKKPSVFCIISQRMLLIYSLKEKKPSVFCIKIFIYSNDSLGCIILTLVGSRKLVVNVRNLLILSLSWESWSIKNKRQPGQFRPLNMIGNENVQRYGVQLGVQTGRSFVFMEALVSDSTLKDG